MITDPSIPPQNIEAEESILGGILLDPKAIGRVVDILVPEAFYVRSHQEIYRAAIALHQKGKPADLMTVSSWLQDHHLLDEVGGIPRLIQLCDRTVSAANVDRYAELVTDKYTRRRLISKGGEIIELARDTTIDLGEVFLQAEEKLRLVENVKSIDGAMSIGDIAVDVFEEIGKIQESGITPAIPTGFYDLDSLMRGGFHRGDLIIVAGRPAMGKTAATIQIADNLACEGNPVLIFSLEMGRDQIFKRMASGRSYVSGIGDRKLEDSEVERVTQALTELSVLPIAIDDAGTASIASIRSTARAFKEKHKSISAISIDYLQLMGGDDDNNRNIELGKITRSLKILAKQLDCPIICLSQLNRGVEARTNKRPLLSDLRESGSIEQDADLIIMLYRDEYYNADSPDRGIAELIVTKHRNGPTGTVKLLFQPEFTKFLNLKKTEYQS